jgi:hypothetical protein
MYSIVVPAPACPITTSDHGLPERKTPLRSPRSRREDPTGSAAGRALHLIGVLVNDASMSLAPGRQTRQGWQAELRPRIKTREGTDMTDDTERDFTSELESLLYDHLGALAKGAGAPIE